MLTAQRLGVGVLSERYPCGTGRRVRILAAWCDFGHQAWVVDTSHRSTPRTGNSTPTPRGTPLRVPLFCGQHRREGRGVGMMFGVHAPPVRLFFGIALATT